MSGQYREGECSETSTATKQWNFMFLSLVIILKIALAFCTSFFSLSFYRTLPKYLSTWPGNGKYGNKPAPSLKKHYLKKHFLKTRGLGGTK